MPLPMALVRSVIPDNGVPVRSTSRIAVSTSDEARYITRVKPRADVGGYLHFREGVTERHYTVSPEQAQDSSVMLEKGLGWAS